MSKIANDTTIILKLDDNNKYFKLQKIIDIEVIKKIIEEGRTRDPRGRNTDYDHFAKVIIIKFLNKDLRYEGLVDLMIENAYVRQFLGFKNDDKPLDRSIYIKFINSLPIKVIESINFYILDIAMANGFIKKKKFALTLP